MPLRGRSSGMDHVVRRHDHDSDGVLRRHVFHGRTERHGQGRGGDGFAAHVAGRHGGPLARYAVGGGVLQEGEEMAQKPGVRRFLPICGGR